MSIDYKPFQKGSETGYYPELVGARHARDAPKFKAARICRKWRPPQLHRPNLQLKTIKPLKCIDDGKQIFRLWIAFNGKHAHQTFLHDAGLPGKRRESYSEFGDIA
jgi:hypothetical protein